MTPRLRHSGLGSTLAQNNADYETLLSPAFCLVDENNLDQQSAVEPPHTTLSVKPAEKWRHYSGCSITQKQIVPVFPTGAICMKLTDSGIKLLLSACSFHLSTPIHNGKNTP